MRTMNFVMFNLVLEKAEEQENKSPTATGSWKKEKISRKTSISALWTMPKSLTVWITVNWKILKEIGIPDYINCFLRNLYAGQEATVRTGHGTTDWFQMDKGVCQACILSPCLFNLYEDFSSVQFIFSVVSDYLRPHELQHARPLCPSLTPGFHSDSHPLSQ